jgi:hypothetical protein
MRSQQLFADRIFVIIFYKAIILIGAADRFIPEGVSFHSGLVTIGLFSTEILFCPVKLIYAVFEPIFKKIAVIILTTQNVDP